MMNPNLPTWIKTSVSLHFESLVGNISCFVEGQIRDTRSLTEFIEVRVDGPDESRRSGIFEFMINIMVQVKTTKNYNRIQEIVGLVANGFQNLLPISDGTAIVGCARLVADHKGRDVRIYQLGQVNPDINIQRTGVAGRYRLSLD